MSQSELARKAGLTPSYISRLESGSYKDIKRDAFQRLGLALDLSPTKLSEIISGRKPISYGETPEQILDRLKLAQPVSIPVYTEYPFHAGEPVEPVEYVYRAKTTPAKRSIEGYIVHGNCLEPLISNGNIIIVDREGEINNGDIVAALIDDKLHIGRLRKIADELYLENNEGRFKFEECQVAAPVIEVIRRLK